LLSIPPYAYGANCKFYYCYYCYYKSLCWPALLILGKFTLAIIVRHHQILTFLGVSLIDSERLASEYWLPLKFHLVVLFEVLDYIE
jgi:hypothetical protein